MLGNWLFKKITAYLMKEPRRKHASYLCDFDRICHEVIPGDVLLVEGHNRISQIIKRVTHSPWTHAAIYIGRLHSIEDPELRQLVRKHYHGSAGQQLLLETIVGLGTKINPITEYKNHHIRICRPQGLSHADTQRVIGYCIHHLGNLYNTRHIIDIGRFLTASSFIPRRWRSSLFQKNPGKATRDVCSVLIASAFTSVKFPILPLIREDQKKQLQMIRRNPKLFTPRDFDYSPYFAIIKYPIFPYSDHSPYHHLPWQEGVISNDDMGVAEDFDDESDSPLQQ